MEFRYLEKSKKGELIYNGRPNLLVFLNVYRFKIAGDDRKKWAEVFKIPEEALEEAITYCDGFGADAYDEWAKEYHDQDHRKG